MKKILILSILAVCSVLVQAQTTVLLNGGRELDLNVTKWYAYNGNTSDRLVSETANVHDTTEYILRVKNQGSGPLHFYAVITLDTIAGIDTTVAITVQQKKFSGESYSDIIASALTSVVSAEQLNVKTTLGVTTEKTETVASYASTTAAYNSVTSAATDLLRQTIIANNDTITVAQRTMANAAQTMTNAAQTVTMVANSVLYPRYIKFRLLLMGNDLVGTGVKIKRIEIQFYN